MSIGINGDIEKIKALEDNILEQYNKNVELANKMEQETEKFAKQANTAIEDYNSNAEAKTEEFNTNATEKKTEISDIAEGVKNMTTAIQLPQFYVDKQMKCHGIFATKLSNVDLYIKKGKFMEGVKELE